MPDTPAAAYPYITWDMSPLRPWEYWQQDAEDWTEAQAVHAMYRQGVEDARDEHQANQELTKGKPQ